MGQVLTYYHGINTVYSNVLIGKTEDEAKNFIKRIDTIHYIDDNQNHIVSEIRVVCEGLIDNNNSYSPNRLNVLVDDDRIIYELKGCG
jgi:hypothetical protein